MSNYRVNALACLVFYASFGGLVLIVTTAAASWMAASVFAFGIAPTIIASLFAVCPHCKKSPLRVYVTPTEPAGRYAPYRTQKRDWPEKICSECGRDLTKL
jgi:hypothetical protein